MDIFHLCHEPLNLYKLLLLFIYFILKTIYVMEYNFRYETPNPSIFFPIYAYRLWSFSLFNKLSIRIIFWKIKTRKSACCLLIFLILKFNINILHIEYWIFYYYSTKKVFSTFSFIENKNVFRYNRNKYYDSYIPQRK